MLFSGGATCRDEEPEVLTEYVKTYTRSTSGWRRPLKREIDRLVDHLAKGIGAPYVIGPRSMELYREREAILANLAKARPAFEVVSLHRLAGDALLREAVQPVRGICRLGQADGVEVRFAVVQPDQKFAHSARQCLLSLSV